MTDWDSVPACPACGSRPAWHREPDGVAVHCTDGTCLLAGGVVAPTLEEAVAAWSELAVTRGGE